MSLRYTKEIVAQRAEHRANWEDGFGEGCGAEDEASVILNTQSLQLRQRNPKRCSTYRVQRVVSATDSMESYQHRVKSERTLLWWNHREPTVEVVIHFLKVLQIEEIRKRWAKISRYLREHGIEAFAVVEPTRCRLVAGLPYDRVHFHILTDDSRGENELRKLFNEACERSGMCRGRGNRLVRCEDFRVDYKENPASICFDYYLKYGEKYKDRAVLFVKGLRLQKFYTIGKWFKDENNAKKSKKKMRLEVRLFYERKESKTQ